MWIERDSKKVKNFAILEADEQYKRYRGHNNKNMFSKRGIQFLKQNMGISNYNRQNKTKNTSET